MIGQAFALNHGVKLKSLMLCDTSPASPCDAKETWAPRVAPSEGELACSLADGDYGALFTEAFKARNLSLAADSRHHPRHHRARLSRLRGGIQNFDFVPRLPTIRFRPWSLRADDQGTPPSGEQADRRARPRRRTRR